MSALATNIETKPTLLELMKKINYFWQYPVITEKAFYEQNYKNKNYFGFPWATVIDRRSNGARPAFQCYAKYKTYTVKQIYNMLKSYKKKDSFTCCQHISFRHLIPIFKALNIITLYTPHKKKGENMIQGIKIKACPLYAVNIENPTKNIIFKDKDFLHIERPYLYSFQGAYNPNWYLTAIRKKIFTMKHPENTYIKHIGNWHFDNVVYHPMQNEKGNININGSHKKRTVSYNCLLLKSRYMLCPSGSGPNSIRLWEALATGAIPIILSDTLDLPEHELWKNAVLYIKEKNMGKIGDILSKISSDKEKNMRKNCLELYSHFRSNYINM